MSAHHLSTLLWKERELLDQLLFRLEVEQLLLTAAKARWVQQASHDIEIVVERLRLAGIDRAMAVAELAAEWDIPGDSTLRQLVAAAPASPWDEILGDHLRTLSETVAEIAEVREVNEGFLRAALRSVHETIAGIDVDARLYDAAGHVVTAPTAAQLVDRNL